MNTDNGIVKLLKLHHFFKCCEHFCTPEGKIINNSHLTLLFQWQSALSLPPIFYVQVFTYCYYSTNPKKSANWKRNIILDVKYCKEGIIPVGWHWNSTFQMQAWEQADKLQESYTWEHKYTPQNVIFIWHACVHVYMYLDMKETFLCMHSQ